MEVAGVENATPLGKWDTPSFANASTRLDAPSSYMLSKARTSGDPSQLNKCMLSKTVYVGHLPLSTTEEQILELFSTAGTPERIIMGLNAHTQAPTGFCFVEFKTQRAAFNAVKYINKTKINSRTIDVDLDPGFEQGRQFGRGDNGAQRGAQFSSNNRGNSAGGRRRGGFQSRGRGFRSRQRPRD